MIDINAFQEAFGDVMSFIPMLLVVFGTIFGLLVGAIPGLDSILAVGLLVPFTFGMEPKLGMGTLISIYVGGISGGLVSATLLGMPGTSSSLVTTFDAYPMAKAGQPGKALSVGIISSFIGGIFSWILLITLTPQLARIGLMFSSFEFLLVALLGFTVIIGFSGEYPYKAIISTLIGLATIIIGIDMITGIPRFTFGIRMLRPGIPPIPALIGLFVISEVFFNSRELNTQYRYDNKKRGIGLKIPWKELKPRWFNFFRSGLIGTYMGILPAVGGSIASFVAYDVARKASSNPDEFGKGSIDGIIAAETSNNGIVGGACIPMLALGIPGSATVAVLMAGLMIHGIQPGPLLMKQHPDIVYMLFICMLLANIIMLTVYWGGGIRFFIWAMSAPKWAILPTVIIMVTVGAYSMSYNYFYVYTIIFFGVLGYIMKVNKYPLPPMVLGLILGTLVERNLRISLSHSKGSFLPFFTRPISLIILALIVLSLTPSIMKYFRKKKNI